MLTNAFETIFLLAVFLMLPNFVFAAPSISGVSGTLTHDDTVTVNGSGFGAKSSAHPVVYSDMENNSVLASIGSWTHAGYPDGFMTVSTSNQRNAISTYNGVCDFSAGNDLCGYEYATTSASTWYIQYWYYLEPSDFLWGEGNIKMFRLWNSLENMRFSAPGERGKIVVEGVDENHGGWGVGWQPVTSEYTCVSEAFGHECPVGEWEVYPGSVGWPTGEIDMSLGAWHQFQFEWRECAPNTPNGVMRWWMDGKLLFDHRDMLTRTNSSDKYPLIIGFYNSHVTDASGHMHIDDVYVDTTWQRIEIGNSEIYNNCSLKEIQTATSWNDGSITFNVNQGSFVDGSTGYLFITDESGARNTGYSIIFGSGSSDTTAPVAPSGLSVL